MRQAFVFDNIAVLVFPWNEPMDPPERGARVEVRLLDHEPPRGTRYAAGNLRSAHFHPYFDGIEPCDRHWRPVIKQDPIRWLEGELGDLRALLARGRVDVAQAPWVDDDAAALREAIPVVTAAVERAWDTVRV
jgi:hypothetical protein